MDPSRHSKWTGFSGGGERGEGGWHHREHGQLVRSSTPFPTVTHDIQKSTVAEQRYEQHSAIQAFLQAALTIVTPSLLQTDHSVACF